MIERMTLELNASINIKLTIEEDCTEIKDIFNQMDDDEQDPLEEHPYKDFLETMDKYFEFLD